MLHSSLTAFLIGQLPAEALWREIETEVRACRAACAKGGSGHIIFSDGPDASLTRQQVLVLLTALRNGRLPLESASYIADAIIMSHRFEFEDDTVGEVVHLLADDIPPVTLAEVEGALRLLKTTS